MSNVLAAAPACPVAALAAEYRQLENQIEALVDANLGLAEQPGNTYDLHMAQVYKLDAIRDRIAARAGDIVATSPEGSRFQLELLRHNLDLLEDKLDDDHVREHHGAMGRLVDSLTAYAGQPTGAEAIAA